MKYQNWMWIGVLLALIGCASQKEEKKPATVEKVVVYEKVSVAETDPNRVLGTVGDDDNLDSMQTYAPPPNYMGFDRLFPSDDLNWAANY